MTKYRSSGKSLAGETITLNDTEEPDNKRSENVRGKIYEFIMRIMKKC